MTHCPCDEFVIKATDKDGQVKRWTKDRLSAATLIADRLIRGGKFCKVEVSINGDIEYAVESLTK